MNPEIDCILVQTDPTFELALVALNDLLVCDCVKVVDVQKTSIDNIESNNSSDECRFIFGRDDAIYPKKRIQAFGRTASSVLRMCMLRSANGECCPRIGSKSHDRNFKKMTFKYNSPRILLSNDTMEYYSHYDMMHPHFMFEHELLQRPLGEWWCMSSTMLVFRRNFSEVIEFNTNLNARDMSCVFDGNGKTFPFGTFESSVNVQCSVHNITNQNHVSFSFLRALCEGPVGAKHILQTYKKGLTQPPERSPISLSRFCCIHTLKPSFFLPTTPVYSHTNRFNIWATYRRIW